MAGRITFQSFQPLPSGAAYYGNAFQLSFVASEPRLLSAFLKLNFNFPDEVSYSFVPPLSFWWQLACRFSTDCPSNAYCLSIFSH
jgi:hypothetical protein